MKQGYTIASKTQPRKNYTLTSVMSRIQRGVTLVGFEASRLRILGVAPFCWLGVILMNEYKFLTFNDDDRGRKEMQKTVDELAAEGWSIDKHETVNGGWSPAKTVALGALFLPLALFGKKKAQIKIMLSRRKEAK
jgi:hypothetical protein